VIQVWGPHEDNDLEAMKAIARPFFPPRPAGAAPEPDYSRPGVLEELATRAGLTPEAAYDSRWSYVFGDAATLARALIAPAGLAMLVGPEREQEFKDAVVAGLAPFRAADGSYRLRNTHHALIARA
jgi:hypothetical protein